jgi:hypothetical protein
MTQQAAITPVQLIFSGNIGGYVCERCQSLAAELMRRGV